MSTSRNRGFTSVGLVAVVAIIAVAIPSLQEYRKTVVETAIINTTCGIVASNEPFRLRYDTNAESLAALVDDYMPTHVVVRGRDYFCERFLPFLGLVCGIAVMLFSFGPGFYFLYLDGWRHLRPQAAIESEPPELTT